MPLISFLLMHCIYKVRYTTRADMLGVMGFRIVGTYPAGTFCFAAAVTTLEVPGFLEADCRLEKKPEGFVGT